MQRPPLMKSMVESALAEISGFCSGRIEIEELTLICSVAPAK
jgi:hypothetical protein